jgi:hypothetical protein
VFNIKKDILKSVNETAKSISNNSVAQSNNVVQSSITEFQFVPVIVDNQQKLILLQQQMNFLMGSVSSLSEVATRLSNKLNDISNTLNELSDNVEEIADNIPSSSVEQFSADNSSIPQNGLEFTSSSDMQGTQFTEDPAYKPDEWAVDDNRGFTDDRVSLSKNKQTQTSKFNERPFEPERFASKEQAARDYAQNQWGKQSFPTNEQQPYKKPEQISSQMQSSFPKVNISHSPGDNLTSGVQQMIKNANREYSLGTEYLTDNLSASDLVRIKINNIRMKDTDTDPGLIEGGATAHMFCYIDSGRYWMFPNRTNYSILVTKERFLPIMFDGFDENSSNTISEIIRPALIEETGDGFKFIKKGEVICRK